MKEMMQVEKVIREEKTAFDKTAVAQQLLDLLSGYRHLQAVQELIKTLLEYALQSLKASTLPESVLLSLPSFYTAMLTFYRVTLEEDSSLIDELLGLRKDDQDPRMLAMEDTSFVVRMVREIQGRGQAEERRKLLVDRMMIQIAGLTNYSGIAAEHKRYLDEFAQLLLSSGEDVQDH